MPLVDVTDILVDPDIAGQEFTVLRRQETVNNFGESTWVTETINGLFGSIQPLGDQNLDRAAEYDIQDVSIKIVTVFRLRGVTKGPNGSRFKPDIILWQGIYFEVTSPTNWSQFGAGFIESEAVGIHYVDPATQFVPPENGARLDFSNPSNSPYAYYIGGIGC